MKMFLKKFLVVLSEIYMLKIRKCYLFQILNIHGNTVCVVQEEFSKGLEIYKSVDKLKSF